MKEQNKIINLKQSVKDVALDIKDSFSLRQFTMILVVVFGVAANIAVDYLRVGFDASIFAYWINLCISQGAVIIIMFCLYSVTSEREENANAEIKDLRRAIYKAHCDLSKYALLDKFDEYVYLQNIYRKKKAYTNKMQRKIFHAKTDERKKELEAELKHGLEIIESIKVKYNKIRISTIFSSSSLPQTDDEDLEDGRSRATYKMLLNKVVSIIAFGVLLSMLVFDPQSFSLGLIVKTCVKIFQAAYAMYIGGSDGVRYVRGPLLTALDNRAQFIQKFIEHNMPSAEQRQAIEQEQKLQEKVEAEEIIARRQI